MSAKFRLPSLLDRQAPHFHPALIDLVFGIVAPLSLAWVVGYGATRVERDPAVRRLLWAGLSLRLMGGLLYYVLLEATYGGGDYSAYVADAFAALGDPTTGISRSIYDTHGRVWSGTAVTSLVTSWFAFVIGRSVVGLFLVFSTISFVGAALFGATFKRVFTNVDGVSYYRWVMLFPSLWFWTAALGKDALIMAGLGMAAFGFVGRRRRLWPLVVAGVAIVFAIRAPYAALAAAALAAGGLVGRNQRGTDLQRVATLAVVALGVYVAIPLVSMAVGVSVTEIAAVTKRIDQRAEDSSYGGSSFRAADDPVTAVATALFRPFPWEAQGLLMLAASAEILLLWGLAVRRRQAIRRFIRDHWRSEFVVVSAAFVLLLAVLVGMAVGNFGTIVRQRVHLYPFLFVVVGGYARQLRGRRVRAAARPRARVQA